MMAGTVYNQLLDTLKGYPDLAYVNNVFKGIRYNIEPDSLPCIMARITKNNAIERDMGQIKKIWLDVDIIALIAVNDTDYAFVGDETRGQHGVLDIENDIRACLQSSYDLAGYSEDIRFEPTTIQDFEYNNIVTYGVVIPIRILYKQTDGV